MNWRDFLLAKGIIDRRTYVLCGALLFALKYGLDRVVSQTVFGKSWSLLGYLGPIQGQLFSASASSDRQLFWTLAALALPFIWIGTSLTMQRLRSAGFSTALVVLFFVPVLNLLFFVALSLTPQKNSVHVKRTDASSARSWFHAIVPRTAFGSAVVAVLINALSAVVFAQFSTAALKNYGLGLFFGVPFCLGLTASLIYAFHERRSIGGCIGVAALSVLVTGPLLMLFAVEGAVCVVMALPLALPIACLGAVLGYSMQMQAGAAPDAPRTYSVVWFSLMAVMVAEHAGQPSPSLFEVRSSIEVSAPRHQVWKHVTAFSVIPEPREWIFRSGIAYPIKAEIFGIGVGAVRHCIFSTGEFVEPIEIWHPPSLLKFSVTKNPAPMQEWTFYSTIHPPHLAHFFVSRGGQFRLLQLGSGATLLEGATWYQHHMWPEFYWKAWADYVIHRIHLRVLNHIKTLSESS